ncbi:MAG TPA: DinB family protein [Thermaerobacter sp.]
MSREPRALWERELDFLRSNLLHYLRYWPPGQEDWRPVANAFSLLDLASHLYGLPKAYAAVLREAPREEIFRLMGGPWTARGPEDLRRLLEEGMEEFRTLLATVPAAEFSLRQVPWPFGEPMTPERLVLNLVTHMYHHRGQFHIYLKQLGAAVDTETVYAG